MSYSIAIFQRNIACSRIRERALPRKDRNRKVLAFFLIFVIIFFSVFYIIQANSVATEGHEIQKYKSEVKKLQSENENIKLKLSGVQSLSFLEEKIEGLNMVIAEGVEYVSPISEVVAR